MGRRTLTSFSHDHPRPGPGRPKTAVDCRVAIVPPDLAAFYQDYARLVRFFSSKRVSDWLRDDVIAEVWLRVADAFRRNNYPKQPKPWLRMIVQTTAADLLGGEHRYVRLGGEGQEQRVRAEWLRRERRLSLDGVMSKHLTRRERQVLEGIYWNRQTRREMARRLDITAQAVGAAEARALARLGAILMGSRDLFLADTTGRVIPVSSALAGSDEQFDQLITGDLQWSRSLAMIDDACREQVGLPPANYFHWPRS